MWGKNCLRCHLVTPSNWRRDATSGASWLGRAASLRWVSTSSAIPEHHYMDRYRIMMSCEGRYSVRRYFSQWTYILWCRRVGLGSRRGDHFFILIHRRAKPLYEPGVFSSHPELPCSREEGVQRSTVFESQTPTAQIASLSPYQCATGAATVSYNPPYTRRRQFLSATIFVKYIYHQSFL